MNEIEDHLDDSDEDTSYLVNTNASTGGAEKSPIADNAPLGQSYYPEDKDYSYPNNYDYNYNNTTTQGYDNNYSNQYNNGIADQDYQAYAQPDNNYNYD